MARNTRNAYSTSRRLTKGEREPMGRFYVITRPGGERALCELRPSGFVRVLRDLPRA